MRLLASVRVGGRKAGMDACANEKPLDSSSFHLIVSSLFHQVPELVSKSKRAMKPSNPSR